MTMKYRIKSVFWLGIAVILGLIEAILVLLFFLILLPAMILKQDCYDHYLDVLNIHFEKKGIDENEVG